MVRWCTMLSKLTFDEVKALAETALELHPHSEPIDLYKFFYQAYMGPSHMLKDKDKVAETIYQEADDMKRAYLPMIQELGDTYVRLSLSVLGFVTMKESKILAEWMLESCIDDSGAKDEFHRLWLSWIPLLQELLPADEKLWNETLTLAEQGVIPSHSTLFHTHYDPHYRVVNIKLKPYNNFFFGEDK